MSLSHAYKGNSPVHHYRADIEDIPYHVLIAYNRLYCSGALLRSRVVVTAASCFTKWKNQRIVIKVGSETVTSLGQVSKVLELKRHEYFGRSSTLDNDIALLMLNAHVSFGPRVKKILIEESDTALEPESSVEVSGWAFTLGQQQANNLISSDMNVLSTAECARHYPNLMTTSNFCAKYSSELRMSDNGGPVVIKGVLVGIMSYGADRASEPRVALLTNVSYFHKWITLNSNRLMMKYCTEPDTNINDLSNAEIKR